MKVWIDGRVVDGHRARIPVTDHGFLYGDGVFEGMRLYAGRLFCLEEHLCRLEISARCIGMQIPGGLDALRQVVVSTCQAFGADEAYIRLVVSRGDGPLGVDPGLCPQPRIVCIVDHVALFPAEKLRVGLALRTASWRRPAADALDPRVKSLNYLNNVLAKREARLAGADEALLLNAQGMVAEASVANVFAVYAGALRTPPATDGALPGITRATLLALAAREGIPAEERSLGRYDLLQADEVFLCGSGAEVVAVTCFDGEVIGKGAPGPVTTRLSQVFDAYVREVGTPIR